MPERLRQLLLDLLRSMPTDAVPVIRCRDCKFASHRAANVYPVVWCTRPDVGYGAVRGFDDYCSYGEKEDENAD